MSRTQDGILLRKVLRILGLVSSSDDKDSQMLIDSGILPYLLHLLEHEDGKAVQHALFILSNITASNSEQVQVS